VETTSPAALDAEYLRASAQALHDLRAARRRNRLADVHWVDALYRVYITALGAVAATLYASSFLPKDPVSDATIDRIVDEGPAVLGAVFALGLFFALRSGARGGPLTLEAPAVFHELLAPVARSRSLRAPAVKQIRFMAFSGAVVGAAVGYLGARRLPEDSLLATVTTAAAFSVAAVGAVGVAMVVSGRRWGIWVANGLGVVLLAWSAADVAAGTTTSPASLLGTLALSGLDPSPLAVAGVALFVAAAVLGVAGVGGTSIEAARRRASLVAQLRFAATMQDVRTVVLLRRQLAQERPRHRPWFRLGARGRAHRLPPAWRRDWHGILRFPLVRLVRMAALSAVAGVALGFVWEGVTPLFLLAALALYLVGYDCVEPLAQEVDHPSRWGAFPRDTGPTLVVHLMAGFVVMLVCCGIAAAAALTVAPVEVVGALWPVVVPVALVTVVAAAVSTSMGAPDTAQLVGMGADMMGFVLVLRMAGPPIAVAFGLVPLLSAGSDPAAVDAARVLGGEQWVVLVAAAGILWLRTREPSRI